MLGFLELFREFYQFPAVRRGKNLFGHTMVEIVAGFECSNMPEQGISQQAEIANGVEYLMAHEFVGEAQSLGIEDAVLGNYDGIFQ